MNIGDKIVYLREQNNLSQKELASLININISVLNRIELNKRSLRDLEIVSFAKVFKVSCDYLLSNESSYCNEEMSFPNKLKQLRKLNNLTQEELARKINTTKASISNYETGYSEPSYETLILIAKTLNTSIDNLLGISVSDQSNRVKFKDSDINEWYNSLQFKDEKSVKKLMGIWEIISED